MFILQNQDGYFLAKSGNWADGRDPNALFRTLYRDEAVNQLFEANSKDYNLRITILSCEMNPKKVPIIEKALLPPPKLDTVNIAINEDASEHEFALNSQTHA